MARRAIAAIAAIALVAICAPPTLAADGTLDPTFASGAGFRADQFSLDPASGSFATGLTLAPGNAPLVTSFAPDATGEEQFTTTKYLPDGSAFDPTFNTTGIRRDQRGFGAKPFSETGEHLVVAPDGTIVVPGLAGDDSGTIPVEADIQRYTPTGALDTAFNGGFVRSNLSLSGPGHESSFADAVALGDGSVVAVGNDAQTATRLEGLVAKYTPTGTLDTSFAAPNGFLHQQFGAGTDITVWERIVMQPDGKLVLLGQTSGTTNGIVTTLERLNANGTPDASFGTAGVVRIQLSALVPATDVKTVPDGIALAPDGSIFVGGSVSYFSNAPDDDDFGVAVTKLAPNGTPDPTFGTGGSVVGQFGVAAGMGHADSSLRDLTLAPDGRIVVAGQASDAAGKTETLVARFLPNGTPDPLFGTGGALIHQFADPASPAFGSNAVAVAVASTGAILIAGEVPDTTAKPRTLLARIVGNTAPTAAIAPVTGAQEGKPVTLDASASTDSDGTITSYLWDLNGDGTFGDATGPKPTVTFPKGPQIVSVKVTDNYGATSTATQTFSVQALPGIVKLPSTGTITGATASLVLSCAMGPSCTGAVALSSVSGRHATTARHKAKSRKAASYGRGTFSITSGGHKTVKIHLTKAARTALGHHGSLKAWMIVTTRAGALSKSSHRIVTLRVHRTKPKHTKH